MGYHYDQDEDEELLYYLCEEKRKQPQKSKGYCCLLPTITSIGIVAGIVSLILAVVL